MTIGRGIEQARLDFDCQGEHLERVTSRLERLILQFVGMELAKANPAQFHMESLRAFISKNVDGYVAPASPDRILRQLRQQQRLEYRVVNRRDSLYEVRR